MDDRIFALHRCDMFNKNPGPPIHHIRFVVGEANAMAMAKHLAPCHVCEMTDEHIAVFCDIAGNHHLFECED